MVRAMHDLVWTAGFLEGEGAFSWCGHTPRVSADQANSWPLERLYRLFGGWVSPKKPTPLSRKPMQTWAVGANYSAGLMMTLYGLMSPERQRQIARVLALWRATPNNFGEKHYEVTINDVAALAAMRRVLAGERITHVAAELGLTHGTLSLWMRGKRRGYLLAQLQQGT
jgi:hypothetical protein